MTRKKQIEAAIKLLESNGAKHKDLRLRIEFAFSHLDLAIDLHNAKRVPRKQVEMYRRALCNLQIKHKKLPEVIKGYSLAELDFDDELKRIDVILANLISKAAPDGYRQRAAANVARALLWVADKRALESGRTPRNARATTKGGPWERLTAILYGDDSLNMTCHLRELKKAVKARNQAKIVQVPR